MTVSTDSARLDLDRAGPGRHFGRILVPDSRNDGAWSQLAVPVVSIDNGAGPNALLMAGNHGDEYEGQLALYRLVAELDPGAVRGRLVIIPCLSMRAARNGERLWPSGANFNRMFDGSTGSGPEYALAAYLAETLIPEVDTVFDIHSGGRSLLFHPMTTMIHDPAGSGVVSQRRRRMVDAMLAWNADFHLSNADSGQSGLLPEEAERQGKVVITGEMGGGGIATAASVQRCVDGLRNVLRHLGFLDEPVQTRASLDLPETVLLRSDGVDNHILAPVSGLFEPLVDPGRPVAAGQPVARLYFPERPDWQPETVTAAITGVVAAIRSMPTTTQGDTLVTVGQICERTDIE